jgi:hypothetical protein
VDLCLRGQIPLSGMDAPVSVSSFALLDNSICFSGHSSYLNSSTGILKGSAGILKGFAGILKGSAGILKSCSVRFFH